MKKGLTYISERTGQLRYANNQEYEEWIQQTSTYIPLVEIKRGQPVSVATIDDLRIVSKGDNVLFEALKNSSDTYVVLTNPSRHESTIGLALEYTKGEFSLKEDQLIVSEKIHIITNGKYIEDKDYYANAFTEADEDSIDATNEEYWPEFFDDYENSIGKKIYIKGNEDGVLTLVPEEAYLAYNNVIIVGFVADANIKNGEKQINTGAIEVQILGDDRGAIDATTFEGILGEDFTIGHRYSQTNGELASYTKLFALGSDDDEKFKFSFNFFEDQNRLLPKGFIAIQRIDGATAYVCVNGEITEEEVINNEGWTAKDRAFVQVAQYYAAVSGKPNSVLGVLDHDAKKVVEAPAGLETFLSNAFAAVSAGPVKSLKDGVEHNANKLELIYSQNKGVYKLEANDIGGAYEVYVSSNLLDVITNLNIASRGSNYNKGYAVLADIRFPSRQNLIGVYNSGKTGLIKQGTRAVFLKQGLFVDPTSPYEPGATYYLGSHGNIFQVPQEFYNSIVQVGVAQTEKNLVVSCDNPRKFNIGDLPVGYMKPSIHGEAEFGFWLMDGKTPHKTVDGAHLLKNLLEFYDESELDIRVRDFGTDGNPDKAESFIIPQVNYKSRFSEENTSGYVAAQIKWLPEAVYKELPRTPFVRRLIKIGGDDKKSIIPDIDITSLMIYGPDEDHMQVPELEALDIKLFVDTDTTSASRNWTQLEPGFHSVNNFTYYGFKWTVMQLDEVDASHPYGTYVLRAVYSGTESDDTEHPDGSVLGVCMQADPFAPPVPLAGFDAKVFVTKHDYYSRQFDAENLFNNFVKESITNAEGTPFEGFAVSGGAVRKDIKYKVRTDFLSISDEENNIGTVEAYLKNILVKSVKDNIEEANIKDIDSQTRNKYLNTRKIQSDIRLSNPSGNDVWNLDYFRGALEYYTSDTTVNENNLESRIANRPLALMPYFIFQKHEEAKVVDDELLKELNATDSVEYPHGIVNKGFGGTLNANQLQGAHLGYGEYVFSQNAGDTLTNEDSGSRQGNSDITIPYIQRYNNHYTMRVGNVIKHYHGTRLLDTEELSSNIAEATITKKHNFYSDTLIYRENFGGLSMKVDIEHNEFDFLVGESDDSFANLKANVTTPSSIRYKYLLHSYQNDNADTSYLDAYSAKDKTSTFEEPMNEALQALYELPLATFQYNRNFEKETTYDKDSYFKRFFGIIVEQTANTSKKFKDDEVIKNATSLDDVKYTYTDDEKESISEYIKLLTDDKEAGLNTNNAIGILLKAAKETQERLLNLEVSTYGKDSPTLPGADVKDSDFKANDQKSTIAGLNRLVKALCREVFQDADPTSIDSKGAWSEDSDNYSRLDMLDKEVNGENAKDDEGQSSRILLEEISTYPDDASVTQTVETPREVVKDAANDNDFDTAQEYVKEVNYTTVDGSSDDFDGLNDAVNRIVAKLNTLTADVKGSDNIKNRPLMLDYIRQTLETILRDVYDDSNATSTALEAGAYKKTNVSRIDRLVQSLFNFDLDTVDKENLFQTFNGKELKCIVTSKTDDGKPTEVAALSPESLEGLNEKASIIDVIVALITGDEKKLVKTNPTKLQDRGITEDGYKVGKDNNEVVGESYNPADYFENNNLTFNHETIVSRLDTIEKVLQLLSLKVQNQLDFRTITARTNASPYHNVTSIDDFFNYVENVFGITFEKNGFYATERKIGVKAESIKNIQGKENKKTSLDLYNIIYDAVKRIKNNEWAIKYNEVVLGPDYDDYLENNNKDNYEKLEDTPPTHTKDYTVTSDMKAVLKLLYGADSEPASDDTNNHTTYEHFKTAYEKTDNFTKSPANGVSVLDCLYTQLYNVPTINGADGKATTGDYNSRENYSTLRYDPMSPRKTAAVDDPNNNSLLGMGRRNKFIAQNVTDHPLSRIDILENEVKAIYQLIGFGSTEHDSYYDGRLTFGLDKNAVASELWGSLGTEGSTANNGVSVSINGSLLDDVHNRYHTINLTASGAKGFHLSAIALQAYFNTTDIASLLYEEKTNGDRDDSPYSKDKQDAITAETKYGNVAGGKESTSVESAYAADFSSYKVITSIKKLLDYSAKIDKALMDFKKDAFEDRDVRIENDKRIWNALGTEYNFDSITDKGTISARLTQNERDIDAAETRITANEESIAAINGKLGTSDNQGTVFERIQKLEAAEDLIVNSLKNTDEANDAIKFDIQKTATDKPADIVYTDFTGSTVKDSDSGEDAEGVVLATKDSVESLVRKAVNELQREMTAAIQNNRKLAALMAYMKCDDIKASTGAVQFVRSSETEYNKYDMQEKDCRFIKGTGDTGSIEIAENNVAYCGESMIKITLEDYVDHLKYTAYVPYDSTITAGKKYENQSFHYGSNNQSSLEDDTYTVKIY
ncbi:MAG: hypothetical protein II304_02450 [Bacteroidales bacterium]|nr:hypothetical protein [Bacteroidales bacterium]